VRNQCIKRVVQDLEDSFVPIILSGYSGTPRFFLPVIDTAKGTNYVGWRTFYYNGYSYFLFVNLRPQDVTYTFFKPSDISVCDIEMIMGSSHMSIDGNSITLQMPSIDVVWIRVYDPAWRPDGEIVFDYSSCVASADGVVVEIDIEGSQARELNTTELREILSELAGTELDIVTIRAERNDIGHIIRIVVVVNDDDTAHLIADAINHRDPNESDGVLKHAKEARVIVKFIEVSRSRTLKESLFALAMMMVLFKIC